MARDHKQLTSVRALFKHSTFLRFVARWMYAAMSVVFLCVNVVCASLGERGDTGRARSKTWTLVLVRVLVNDLLFIIEAVCLATTLLLLTRYSPTTSPYLHSKVNNNHLITLSKGSGSCFCNKWVKEFSTERAWFVSISFVQPQFLVPFVLQGTSLCRTAVLGASVILLFLSRACYNLTVLIMSQDHKVESFGFDWYNISDQV